MSASSLQYLFKKGLATASLSVTTKTASSRVISLPILRKQPLRLDIIAAKKPPSGNLIEVSTSFRTPKNDQKLVVGLCVRL